ncbi:4a-hydroxytetrahydrobiopterin dehydratase [Frankia sp. Cas3]|uniref:4a-hydroxytetrahydrobiopterin dehydratase n=1 Tax=Frankia sp. Cas3 TaxID=3073926 RepID=UPI002AD2C1B7|nr:4a-hydroxytetrahydrobiopterin dehydratase [Frankia sp. Cas3]
METVVFISYRRDDTSAEAGRLQETLRAQLGDAAVFLDTSAIGIGDEWPREVEDALQAAPVVLAVMGVNWLRVSDEFGYRRIDQPDDWVRRELENALATKKAVLPVLVQGARMPPTDKFPTSLADLPRHQAVEIRRDYWDHDTKLIISRIEALTKAPLKNHADLGLYPAPMREKPDPLSDERIDAALNGSLHRWRRTTSPFPGAESQSRVELFREYKFKTFTDAIGFMSLVVPGCITIWHHPRWENVWRTLNVYLTTWDIGQRISDRDIVLALYLDRAFSDFSGRDDSWLALDPYLVTVRAGVHHRATNSRQVRWRRHIHPETPLILNVTINHLPETGEVLIPGAAPHTPNRSEKGDGSPFPVVLVVTGILRRPDRATPIAVPTGDKMDV